MLLLAHFILPVFVLVEIVRTDAISFPDLRKQERQLNGEALLVGLRQIFIDRIKPVLKGFVFR